MIAMVKGTLMEKSEGEAVVMTAGGLGLRVMCSMNTLAVLPAAGQECTLYTFMNVREDAMELFGFCQKEERDMFKRLTSVSGIGPRSALETVTGEDGIVRAQSGDTGIFIMPGYTFHATDALITNFHLPQSTLLMLISALMGREEALRVYREAVKERYRFFSFGDAMLIL